MTHSSRNGDGNGVATKLFRFPALEVTQGPGRTLYSFAVDGKLLTQFTTRGLDDPALPFYNCIAISQTELSRIVGMSREMINKQLQVWVKDCHITLERRRVRVLRPDALARILAVE